MLDLANLCICAEAVGGMTASYLKTVQYTKEREQFGQPISNFQVLQHKMVDMFIEAEVSKSLLFKRCFNWMERMMKLVRHIRTKSTNW